MATPLPLARELQDLRTSEIIDALDADFLTLLSWDWDVLVVRYAVLGMPDYQAHARRPALETGLTSAMQDGRQANSERRRRRVAAAIKNIAKNGTPISVSRPSPVKPAWTARSSTVTATYSPWFTPPNSIRQPRTRPRDNR